LLPSGLDIADSVIKHNQERAKSSLENARKDGHICFKSKYTRRDMTVLAETCQKLAKFPSLRDYGPEFVKTEHYLQQYQVQPAFLLCKQTNSDQNQL
jgi:hypothetical protein